MPVWERMIMLITKTGYKTEYRTPVKACRRCGTRRRFASTGNCVECTRLRDRARPGRESYRSRCENILYYQMGYDKLWSYSRAEKDYLIGSHFPNIRDYLLREYGVMWWMGGGELDTPIPF